MYVCEPMRHHDSRKECLKKRRRYKEENEKRQIFRRLTLRRKEEGVGVQREKITVMFDRHDLHSFVMAELRICS